MPPLAIFSMTGRQSVGMERSISNNSMESYWTNVSSSFRVNKLLSPSSKRNSRSKKDDDDEDDTSRMIYTDDSSSSDNGSDSDNHPVHNSPTTSSSSLSAAPAFHGQQRSFYDMIDDRYNHGIASSKLVTNVEVASTYMDDRNQELQRPQQPLPHKTDISTKSDNDDDVVDTSLSTASVNSGSPNSVFLSKKSASRIFKVTTQRLTESNKLKYE
jgi:hypothetical protein